MQGNQEGPPELEDWEALHPALFAAHGEPVTLAVALVNAPAEVRELVALVEASHMELTWEGEHVGLREKDKAKAALCMDAVRRCVDIANDQQEVVSRWLASLLR